MKPASEIIFDPKCEIYESFMVIDTIEIYNGDQVITTTIFHGVYDRAEEAYQIALHLFEKTSTGAIMKNDSHEWLWKEELKKRMKNMHLDGLTVKNTYII